MGGQSEGTISAAKLAYNSRMTRIFIALATTLGLLATPLPASAKSGLEGRWKNGKMEIVIAPCGAALCGTVVKASPKQQARAERGSGTDLIGAKLITGIRPTGPQTYRANVYLADRDMNVSGTIRAVNPNRLNVRGCLYAIICKSTNWDRIG
jgi:uncharacterized protein (DUF2147 family)